MTNNIIQLPNRTEQYCLDMPSSRDFHDALSSTAKDYDAFLDKAKGLLSNYFTKQSIQTKIFTTICDDLHMSPQGYFQVIRADLSFNCTQEDVTKLSQNIDNVFEDITPPEIRANNNWARLPLQKYPIIGKF